MTQGDNRDFCQEIMERSAQPGFFSALVGMEFDRLDKDGAQGHFVARQELCNPFGIVHGAVYYGIMDQLAGMLASSTGIGGVTLDCSVNYLKSARLGDTVRCVVEPVKVGRSVGVYEGKCFGADGSLQCTGTFHLFFTRPVEELVK